MLARGIPPWTLMWLIALALFAIAKLVTLALADLHAAPWARRFAYLFLVPGMNAKSFCLAAHPSQPPSSAAIRSLANVLLGAILLWGLARCLSPQFPLLRGWIGMSGMILLLHFGLLQLISFVWQRAGSTAPPLMNQPILSAFLSEFWGLRWNTAFHGLAQQFLFRPLARYIRPTIAMLLTFAISGAIHDLIISLPARGGFGLPTTYFLLQGLGILCQRSRLGRRLLQSRLLAHGSTLLFVALPVPLLFHPPFVTRIILPFMVAIRALPTEVFP